MSEFFINRSANCTVPRRTFARSLFCIAFLLCLAVSLLAWQKPKASAGADDPARQAEALLTLSERQNYENHALALKTAQQALVLWQSLANNEGIARAYAMVALCYFAQSDLPEAIQNYEKALALWRDLNSSEEQAEILIMLGYIEDRKGEWANSIALLTQAQSLLKGTNDPVKLGQIAGGFADIFNESGLPENGLIQYQRALDYYRQTPDTRDDMTIIWAIGITYYRMGNYPEALTYLQQARDGFSPHSIDAATCSEYLGRVYRAMGEFPTALQHFQFALDIYIRTINPREAALIQGLIGQIYQQQGKLAQARQIYQQALATFRRLADRINLAVLYYVLGKLELASGNDDAAEEYLRQSIEVTEGIRQVSTSRDLTVAFSASVYERYESYIECLMHKHRAAPTQGFAIRAFEIAELARGRSLIELLRATGTNLAAGIDPQLAAQEKSLRQLLRVKEDYKVVLLSKADKKAELDTVDAELARLEGKYQQVNETIRARYPSYEQITKPAQWSLAQIQEQVIADDQTLLLEYSLGAQESYVWAVTRDDIKSYNLPSRERINEAAQKVYKLLAAPPDAAGTTALTAALQELSQMVLSPVAAELTKSRIIIVADGVLHYIPFQALPTPSANTEPLIANFEVINTPSASILGELRKEAIQRQPSKLLAAFGDPVFATNYAQQSDTADSQQVAANQALELAPWRSVLRDVELTGDAYDPLAIKPLFYTKRELANLRDVAKGSESFIASGFTASREQLLKTNLSDYAILHFATHGLLDPKRPELSGLVLSTVDPKGHEQNGFISLQDIYGLRAPVDLVVLSACQTALGKDVRGEGLLGLTRGFMYAGASSVIASLWKVDDEATAELMRQSYVNMLQKGMTPAAALRAAQNSIRQRPEWQAPYYWAGFTLQGEYRQIIKPTSARRTTVSYQKIMLLAAGMLFLIGAGLWYGYRRRRNQQTL
jgi:CHAT domain-containing protein